MKFYSLTSVRISSIQRGYTEWGIQSGVYRGGVQSGIHRVGYTVWGFWATLSCSFWWPRTLPLPLCNYNWPNQGAYIYLPSRNLRTISHLLPYSFNQWLIIVLLFVSLSSTWLNIRSIVTTSSTIERRCGLECRPLPSDYMLENCFPPFLRYC